MSRSRRRLSEQGDQGKTWERSYPHWGWGREGASPLPSPSPIEDIWFLSVITHCSPAQEESQGNAYGTPFFIGEMEAGRRQPGIL